MRFGILFIFLMIIAGAMFFQSRPEADPFEESGKRIIREMKREQARADREAALLKEREALELKERKKETEKLTRKHPKLLDRCLELGGYRRSNFHLHELADGSKLAFCVSGEGIDLKNFIGSIYYQAQSNTDPQVIEIGDGSDGPPGFDTNAAAISFKFDGFHADEKIFFNYSLVPALRTTYNCSAVTKECSTEKIKCALSKKEKADENYLSEFKVDSQYLARIENEDLQLYDDYFSALAGDRKLQKVFLNGAPKPEGRVYDQDRFEIMQIYLKSIRRAGCL